MFPTPDGGAAAPAPAPAVESKGSRTALLALGGVLAAAVVGGGAYFLLNSGGSSDPTPVAAGVTAKPSAPAPAASPSPSPTKPAVIRPASASVTSRDPFKPLYAAAKPGTVTGGSGSTPAPSASATPITPATQPTTPTVTLAVSKIDTKAQTATVSVDGKPYAVSLNTLFAKNFVMYSVFNAQCVGILFGDQSVPVCTNLPQSVSP
jgi:hypothetical protein